MRDKKLISQLSTTIVVLTIAVIALTLMLLYTTYQLEESKLEKVSNDRFEDVYIRTVQSDSIYSLNRHGEELFKSNCTMCHHIVKNLTGPSIQGSIERLRGKERFLAFVTNEDSLLQLGDRYVVEIQEYDPSKGLHQHPEWSTYDKEALFYYFSAGCLF